MWPSLTGRNYETMGEGVAKFHKGVAESHKRKPWWKRVTKTYKETMGEGCRNSEGGMRLPSNI